MKKRSHNRLVAGMLLLAAFACYVDAPRVHLLSRMGDTLNAVRVLDVASHIHLAARALTDTDAAEELEDGRRSMELVAATPMLRAALPGAWRYTPPTLAPDETRDGLNMLASPVAALPGMLLALDLPPPYSAIKQFRQGPRPSPAPVASTARAPPLQFGPLEGWF